MPPTKASRATGRDTIVTFRVDRATWDSIVAIASREQLTASDIIRRAVRQYLETDKGAA